MNDNSKLQRIQRENPKSCFYCGGKFRRIKPITILNEGSESSAIQRTDLCDTCGASLINRNSPKSGDCFLQVPKAYAFALEGFRKRLELLLDPVDDEVWFGDWPGYLSLEDRCTLLENPSFEHVTNHELHGDAFVFRLCTCTSVHIYFDGYVSIWSREERETPWDHETQREFKDHIEAFENLRQKLDSLLYGEEHFIEAKNLIGGYSVHNTHPYFCTGKSPYFRFVYWWAVGEDQYPERYTLPSNGDLED